MISAAAVGLLDEYYNAGRDLASVYDQMLGLIRDALLVKTSKTDVSALISPAYSVKTLQALCDGLASSTLIARQPHYQRFARPYAHGSQPPRGGGAVRGAAVQSGG